MINKKNTIYRTNRGENKYIGLLFILPWLFGFLAFKAGPLFLAFVFSFTKYNVLSPPRFIGLANYKHMFSNADFINSVKVNFLYVLFTVPGRLIFSLFIAYLLTTKIKGIGIFRSIYYIPSLMGGNVAIAILWRYMFLKTGLLNSILANFGIGGYAWLTHNISALIVVSLLHVWQFGATMIIFLAALKGVPVSLKEAAFIDGAKRRTIFLRIILPYISPVIFFNLMTNLINAFQEFNSPFMVTGGGPGKATTLISLLIYNNAFTYLKMGYSSAISVFLFAIIVLITVILFKTSDTWVNYQD